MKARYRNKPEIKEKWRQFYLLNSEVILDRNRAHRRSSASPIETAFHIQAVLKELKTEGEA